MHIRFIDIEDPDEKERICRDVLSSLPLWFGIPSSNEEYARGVRSNRFIAVVDDDEKIGFASIKSNNAFAAELYVLGLRPERHRGGIGSRLLGHIEEGLKSEGYKLLEVKTLDESRENEEYRRTRLFYRKAGFLPLDVLPELWGPENPCLLMVKPL
jgi:Acetyltransferases